MNKKHLIHLTSIVVCACISVLSAVMLISYAADYFRTRQVNAELAASYHVEGAAPTASETSLPTTEAAVAAAELPIHAVEPTEAADETPLPFTAAPKAAYDPFGGYPDNPYREVLPRFEKLHRMNPDICGWITIGTELDQAVVQRDNLSSVSQEVIYELACGDHNNCSAVL